MLPTITDGRVEVSFYLLAQCLSFAVHPGHTSALSRHRWLFSSTEHRPRHRSLWTCRHHVRQFRVSLRPDEACKYRTPHSCCGADTGCHAEKNSDSRSEE